MRYSIVWKIRPKGTVVFRHDYAHDHDSLEAALAEFRRVEPDAYILRAYRHEPINPHLLECLLTRLEQKAVDEGWRSLGD